MLLRTVAAITAADIRRGFFQQTKPSSLGRFQRNLSSDKVPTKTEVETEENSSASESLEKHVLLHNDDGKVIGSKSLQVAQEIAQKRKMSLLKIESPTSKKDWYQLVPMNELVKRGTSKKRPETKLVQIGANIAKHDLQTKAKQAAKWVSQNLEVRVSIAGNMSSSKEQLNSVFEQFKQHLEGTPHECTETKSTGGILRATLQSPKKTKQE